MQLIINITGDHTMALAGSGPSPLLSPQGSLRETGHDAALQEGLARIVEVARPSPSIRRFTARLEAPLGGTGWSLPNVAFRLQLGAAHDHATRIYTVRSFDPVACTLTFDVVQHGHDSPMMQWSALAALGDGFALTGPRPHPTVPLRQGRRAALFLDDSAMPALYAMLNRWPAGLEGIGWVATEDAEAFAQLPHVPGLDLHHIAPGQHDRGGHLLIRAMTLPEPDRHVIWAAGERGEMRAIRQHFLIMEQLDKADVAITAYWKRGMSNTQVDMHRRRNYDAILARGGTMADIDDLAIVM
jgi:NADPH-dependent ferric siderophore reductase